MIGYTDPNQGINDTNELIKSGKLNGDQTDFLAKEQNKRINGSDSIQDQLDANTAEMNAELAQNDLLLKGHEDYEKRKAEITAKYNKQSMQIQQSTTLATLNDFSNAAGVIGDAVANSFGKTSGAARTFFAIQKALAIATATMNLNVALTEALAEPGPLKWSTMASVASLGATLISNIVSTAGQFHGGIDELPASLDNKSFVLKAGERVIQPEANTKLTKFLDQQQTGSTTAGDTTVNAPLIIQGDVAGDDAKFNQMLQKHANSVTQAVRSTQKRNS